MGLLMRTTSSSHRRRVLWDRPIFAAAALRAIIPLGLYRAGARGGGTGAADRCAPLPARARVRDAWPMAATATPTAMSDERLVELLSLMRDADSVELKLTVPEASQRSGIAALGLDPLEAQIRQVFFFDTPDLALDRAGVVVRARRVQRKGDDTVVKLRPVVPDRLPSELRQSPGFFVEVDAMPGGFVCSASLKGVLAPGSVAPTIRGERPLRK